MEWPRRSAPVPPSPAGSGRRRGRCWPGPRAAGTSARLRCRRRWPAAGGSPACRYSRGGGRPPWPVRRSRRWWSPGQWSGARRRVPPRPAKPGPATRGSPGRVDGRGPTGSCAGRFAQGGWRLDRAAARVQAVPPVRNTSASSMQSPPASADATASSSCRSCSPAPGHRPGGIPAPGLGRNGRPPPARSRRCRTSSGRPRCRARVAGRSSGIGHQAAVVEGPADLDPVGVVAWQHLLGAPPGPFPYKTIIPEAQEHLLAASGRPDRPPSVDSG